MNTRTLKGLVARVTDRKTLALKQLWHHKIEEKRLKEERNKKDFVPRETNLKKPTASTDEQTHARK